MDQPEDAQPIKYRNDWSGDAQPRGWICNTGSTTARLGRRHSHPLVLAGNRKTHGRKGESFYRKQRWRGRTGDATCFTSTEQLRATRIWHRLVEPRAGLMTLAGTVTPGIFACATRPRRLVKEKRTRCWSRER